MKRIIPFTGRLSDQEARLWIDQLQSAMPDFSIRHLDTLNSEQSAVAEVAIVANPDAERLSRLENLKWIQSVWAGVDEMLNSGVGEIIPIVRLVDPNLAKVMSEAVLAATFYLHRDIPRYLAQQSQSLWLQHSVKLAHERTVGILGLGELGLEVAKSLVANGFQVSGWSRSAKETRDLNIVSVHGRSGFKHVLNSSEILIVLLPLTPHTQGVINSESIKLMPEGASLVNFGRGPIVEEAALLEALAKGHLQHAVLDVFDQEPLPAAHPYWSNDKITVWPHIAAPTNKASAANIVAHNVRTYFTDNKLPPTINHQHRY